MTTPLSPDQAALIAAGAAPVTVDVAALQRQIADLTARMDEQSRALGVPTNPVGAAVTNLIAHVKARANANPGFDFGELADQLASMGENPAVTDVELVRVLVDDAVTAGSGLELHYLRQLASNLYKEVLKANKSTTPAPVA